MSNHRRIRAAALTLPPILFLLIGGLMAGPRSGLKGMVHLRLWFGIFFAPIYLLIVRIAFMLTRDPVQDFMHVGRFPGRRR